MTYKLDLGRHQLAVSLSRKRGRAKKNLINHVEAFISQLIQVGTDRRFAGQPVSRVLRRVFEKKKVRQLFGSNLMVLLLVAGTMAPPISAFTTDPVGEVTAVTTNEVQLTTEETIRVPLDSFKVTQGYHLFHRAVDLKEAVGAPIYPLKDGVVKEVVPFRFGYGNYVVIDHGNGFESLYAHLTKIVVAKGEKVNQNTVIGTVGNTGWSTGSHLHLEVYDHGQAFNPLLILK